VTCDLLALEDHQERRSKAQKEKAAFVITTPSTAVL